VWTGLFGSAQGQGRAVVNMLILPLISVKCCEFHK